MSNGIDYNMTMPSGVKKQTLERIADGDSAAVRELVDLYGDLVWSLARRFTGSEADAEEAVQDIFVLLWRKAHHYDRDTGAEVTFVSVLARRTLIDRWRRAKRRPNTTELKNSVPAETKAARLETDELAARAADAFAMLEPDAQTALRLSIEFGCSHADIADITETPLGTVKSRIRTGLRTIRTAMKSDPRSEVSL